MHMLKIPKPARSATMMAHQPPGKRPTMRRTQAGLLLSFPMVSSLLIDDFDYPWHRGVA
jgi:hypothetical protein